MKQTHNAIKFLMAQYRAIFKQAYFKGLVSVATVAACFTLGQAQAAEVVYPFYNISEASSGGTIDDQEKHLNNSSISGSFAGLAKNSHSSSTFVSGNTVSGGELIIGKNGHIEGTIEKNAFGGFIALSEGEANSVSNKLTINDTIEINGSLYGGQSQTGSGNASANSNILTINSGSAISFGATYGTSRAIAGGKVTGTIGATAKSNEVYVNGALSKLDISKMGIVAGGWAKPSDTATSGDFIAQQNTAVLDYISADMEAGNSIEIYGGHVFTSSADSSISVDSLQSIGNNLDINNSTISVEKATSGLLQGKIIGNSAQFSFLQLIQQQKQMLLHLV